MKKIFLFLVTSIVCCTLYAQTKSELKPAYKYRADIPKSVLKETRSWPDKYGILHHDWIENLNGKSIDLQGNVLFPQYNYTRLERHCGGRFWVMTIDGKKGVVDNEGKVLVPFEYNTISFYNINYGIVRAWKKGEMGAGKYFKIAEELPFQEVWDADTTTFHSNVWIDRFACFYNKGQYRKAQYCLDYYTRFEQTDMYSTKTLPLFKQTRYHMLNLEQRKEYSTVISFVKESRLPGTNYDASKMALELNKTDIYTSKQLEAVNQEIEYINDIYYECIRGVARQAEVKERREKAAIAAAAILGAAAVTTAAVVSEQQAKKAEQERKAKQSQQSASTATSKMSKTAASFAKDKGEPASTGTTVDDDDDDDPNYGEVEVEEIHVTCDRCNGSGKCQECGGTGHTDGIGGHTESCHACQHGKCVGCQGRGYNIKYR
ncbi:MAG: hypothetical protein IKC19_00490 [Bacteroidales bacterium]|nr:hypothetical protein [Bacteroidales bacterium]